MSEYGRGCCCGMECGKRRSQGGINVRLRIVKDGRKGWGLRAGEFIQCGQFVCEYAGELLTTNEARRRQNMYDQQSKNGSSSALLVPSFRKSMFEDQHRCNKNLKRGSLYQPFL